MLNDWSPLTKELAIWRRSGLTLPIWWRDDDATQASAPLDKLKNISEELGVPVHIAAIPKNVRPSLIRDVAAHDCLIPMVHGLAHENHSAPGEKKSEFDGARPGVEDDLETAMTLARQHFGDRLLPVFVPPWNRISADLYPALTRIGYTAVSTYTPRARRFAVPGLVQINTHLDPVAWRDERRLITPSTLIAQLTSLLIDRRLGPADETEPLGLLTHHLIHDLATWAFIRDCLKRLLDGGAVPASLEKALP